MSNKQGWIGVDLDGTLAHYTGWVNVTHIGEPIAPMLELVKEWISEGERVKIFTARMYRRVEFLERVLAGESGLEDLVAEYKLVQETIWNWLEKHGLPRLEITCVKDFGMVMLYDDRCVQVETNTGRLAHFIEFGQEGIKPSGKD